jgi:hypothetical protein
MAVNESDLDLLEEYLDGALEGAAAAILRERLALDEELAASCESMRHDRALRAAHWAALEPTETDAQVFASRMNELVSSPIARRRYLRRVGALAACVLLSFTAGYALRGGVAKQPGVRSTDPVLAVKEGAKGYQVALVDQNDQVKAIQTFDSLEKADEFTRDMKQWQERQQQLRQGAVVIVADQF